MAVAPRSEAIEKYAMLAVVRTTMAIWWKSRALRGLCITQSAHVLQEICKSDHRRTVKVIPVTTTRQRAMKENAAHSQSEPCVEICSIALGGLRFNASLAIADLAGDSESR